MRNLKSVEFNGEEVTVKELTVTELDALLVDSGGEITMLDRFLEKDMLTGNILSKATGIKVADLSAMTPSKMRPLIDAFKEVNPDFFEMARREIRRAEEMSKALGKSLGGALVP